MKKNPYTLTFGKEPSQSVSRLAQSQEVLDSFLSEAPSQQVFMITGVRGSGKTVFMTEISKRIEKENDWIVIELNPARDLLVSLAAKLYNERPFADLFKRAKIDLSFFGIGLEITKSEPITDIEVALSQMLDHFRKQGKKLLITIDEVTSTQEMRAFASAFQILIRKDLPLFLLMTGLYENIDALQNDKILTFLHRAPKIRLQPLNTLGIIAQYQKTFQLEEGQARAMAKLTNGYPFAFQVLGYYTYEHGGDYTAALPETKQYLAEYAYDKIWSECSRNDRRVLHAVASTPDGKVSDIRSILQFSSNELSPYRDRLIKKGLLAATEHGYVRIVLPFLDEYILAQEY